MVEEWKENFDNNFFVGVVSTDLSKAFDCIPLDSLCYICSYLKDRKQCVLVNNKQIEFDTIISGLPHG